jgi:hypothetical protein
MSRAASGTSQRAGRGEASGAEFDIRIAHPDVPSLTPQEAAQTRGFAFGRARLIRAGGNRGAFVTSERPWIQSPRAPGKPAALASIAARPFSSSR